MAPSDFHGADGIDPKDQGSELVAFALPHDFGSNITFLDAKARRLLELLDRDGPLSRFLMGSKPRTRILRILRELEEIDDGFELFWTENEERLGTNQTGFQFDKIFAPRFTAISINARAIGRILKRAEEALNLRTVSANSQQLLREAIDAADAIKYFSERSKYYIRGLTELARYNKILDREPTNLNTFFMQQRVLLAGPKSKTSLNILNRLPTVRIDYSHCFSLFSNLIRNSIKYRRGKKCRISIAFDERAGRDLRALVQLADFVPHLEASESHWTIHIIDDGIGIETSQLVKIFDPFRRGLSRDEEARRSVSLEAEHAGGHYSGIGLGLAIAQRVAVLYGGDIYANSTLGEGTCISVDLPRNVLLRG